MPAHEGSCCPMCDSKFASANQYGKLSHSLYDTARFCGGCTEGGEKERLLLLESLKILDTPREHVFDAITDVVKRVFATPASHLVLIDAERCWFKSWTGNWHDFEVDKGAGPCVECPREMGWCNYIFVPTTAELLIIEDARTDARVSLNPFVVGPPYFRSYVGAPLVGSKGERYGTLCVVDFVPRSYTAEKYSLLCNFAAIAVEEIERNRPLQTKLCENTLNSVWTKRHMDISMSAARDGVIMLDLRESRWPIAYSNPKFQETLGASCALEGRSFWDYVELTHKSMYELKLDVGLGCPFRLQVHCKAAQQHMELLFVPATTNRFAPSKATGIPAWAPFEHVLHGTGTVNHDDVVEDTPRDLVDHVKSFWFAIIVHGSSSSPALSFCTTCSANEEGVTSSEYSSGSSSSLSANFCEYPVPVSLELDRIGPLIGTGSFGKVYRGINSQGKDVAIKLLDCRRRDEVGMDDVLKEVQLSSKLDHPCLVKTSRYGISRSGVEGDAVSVVWMVQELCDLGTLVRATERGLFRKEQTLTSPADMEKIISALIDVATGLRYIHDQKVIHGDLTGRNVLLMSADSAHGFVAKLADFGLSRYMYSHGLVTNVMGTVTHMPPEVLDPDSSLLVPEGDVWAFGVVSWELYHGKQCYLGKKAFQVVVAVMANRSLEWPEEAPKEYVKLMTECLSYEYTSRPSASQVLSALSDLRGNMEEFRCEPLEGQESVKSKSCV
eukprot:TRINITY_DN8910_c0_g1_i2.p1 TRINITY_DN8910_c0_g1~~TRINITY_DN8910_c0_g1_i2.p1  ORF type:complete len:724 (-),score=37.43 TRINITY_DN8910_c0_g1_i2:36-2207(-)